MVQRRTCKDALPSFGNNSEGVLFKVTIRVQLIVRTSELAKKVYCHYLDDNADIKESLTYESLLQEATSIAASLQAQGSKK